MIWSCRHGITAPASFGTTNPAAPFGARGACPRTSTCFSSIDSLSEGTMNSDGRSRRRELVEEAYDLQVKAGLMASRIPFVGYYHFPDPDLSHPTPLHSLSLYVRAISLFATMTLPSCPCSLPTHSHSHQLTDSALRNMAHLVSALRFSPTVPGPLSSQFIPTALRHQSGLFFCSLRSE